MLGPAILFRANLKGRNPLDESKLHARFIISYYLQTFDNLENISYLVFQLLQTSRKDRLDLIKFHLVDHILITCLFATVVH